MKRPVFIVKFLALLVVATVTVATGAQAHGPSRLKVIKTIDVAAPPAKVWSLIADFDKINVWLPAVETVDATGGNTPNAAKRTLHLKGGGDIDEALTRYNADGMTYSYEITKVDIKVLPVNDYASTITVSANAAGGSTVEWRGAFYRGYMLNDPPKELNDDASQAAVEGVYDLGLKTIKQLAEK